MRPSRGAQPSRVSHEDGLIFYDRKLHPATGTHPAAWVLAGLRETARQSVCTYYKTDPGAAVYGAHRLRTGLAASSWFALVILGVALDAGCFPRASQTIRVLGKIPDVFELARKATHIIHQNLFLVLFISAVGIVPAVTGVVNPLFAADAMLFSTLVVIGNSLRLGHRVASREYSARIGSGQLPV